jgi:hypothetical protein
MRPNESPRRQSNPLAAGLSDAISRWCSAPSANVEAPLNSTPLTRFRWSLLFGAMLFASGLGHLAALWITAADWSGPLSLRKPGLFGVSAGVTVWSIVWVLAQLVPHRGDRWFCSLMSGGLLLEVGLITLQQWRGVPSHFNHATTLDALIEAIRLGLILLVTAGVAWLCWRSRWLRPMTESQAIAIRAGLWFLLISCGLGLLTTVAGEVNLAHGRPPEVWGRAGVLKYPHGAALHAIQVLPLLAWLLQRLRVAYAAAVLRAAVVAQGLFLAHASGQTLLGRARTDIDGWSVAGLAIAGSLLVIWIGIQKAFQTDRSPRPESPRVEPGDGRGDVD